MTILIGILIFLAFIALIEVIFEFSLKLLAALLIIIAIAAIFAYIRKRISESKRNRH